MGQHDDKTGDQRRPQNAQVRLQGVHLSAASSRLIVSSNRPKRSLASGVPPTERSEEHTSELQSPCNLVCRLLLEKKKKPDHQYHHRACKQLARHQFHTRSRIHARRMRYDLIGTLSVMPGSTAAGSTVRMCRVLLL